MPWNVVVQLGISGLVVFTGYKIAILLIAKWSEGDKERTKIIGEGFKAIAEGHQAVLRTMNEHQLAEMGVFNMSASLIERIDEKLDNLFDLTPVRSMRESRAAAATQRASEEATPVERPEPKFRKTPAHGNPSQPYGLKPIRPKNG